MISAAMWKRARELTAEGMSFVTATVVRVERPTSVEPGDVAIVLGDGTIEGFVGGVCTEHSVRAHALEAMATGQAVVLRILPFAEEGEASSAHDLMGAIGAVTVQNPCLSGGAVELFLEPVLPARRVLVVGETPIADALLRMGEELDFAMTRVVGDEIEIRPGDLALVVASHGRSEMTALRHGLDACLPYVGLVASGKRGVGVLAELRGDGVSEEHLAQIDVPAGIDIGARTPAEIALSILARIVATRRDGSVQAPPAVSPIDAGSTSPTLAVDPICGMTVAAVANTPSVQHDGETVYFCCEGCMGAFNARLENARAPE